ncbi:hypothetical protein HID58_072696 [Brassica napus]|uniref:Uncharacterized protein n=1 Tax=Brassica napus TaxID=3708 RepID=A0ABQ7Z5D3_BRANA|nr:hypothetical protein HID58_072696 [Brassica napus]
MILEAALDHAPETSRLLTCRHQRNKPWLTRPMTLHLAHAPRRRTRNRSSRFRTEINPLKPPRDRMTGLTRNTCGEHQDTQRNTATPPPGETEKRLQPSEPSHPRRERKMRGEKEVSSDGRGRTGAEEAADPPTRSATRLFI